MGLHTLLVTGDGLAMGRFDIPPTHAAWRRDNRQHGAHLLAFPGPPVRITFPGEVPVVADRHQVLFYSDAQVYRRSLLSADGDHCTFVVVADDVLRRIVREFDPAAAVAEPFAFRHTQAFIDSRTYLAHRTLALCADPGVECATRVLETVVRDCLAAAYRPPARRARIEPARTAAGQRDRFRLVEEAKAVVADPYGRPPSLESVATRVGASPFHLTRVFGDVTGLPLHRYVTQIRLRSAVDLVLDPDRRLASIAYDLGFANQAHFTTAFRGLFGITPDGLRRQCAPG